MNRPNPKEAKIIVLDTESYDPELTEKGTGVYRKDGYLLGFSVRFFPGEFSEYYNLGHKGADPEEKNKNIAYLKDIINSGVPILGTNIIYDLDWIKGLYGVFPKGHIHDILIAEPLIDENKMHYSLDSLAQDYLYMGKVKNELEDLCRAKGLSGDFRKHLWMFPYEMVREYAIGDVDLPLAIFNKQVPILKKEGLWELYKLETRLIPLLLQMRSTGVRISNPMINCGTKMLYNKIKKLKSSLYEEYGEFNIKSGKQIARIFDELNIPYPITDKGNPNLDKNTLPLIEHPMVDKILAIRNYDTILKTFFINSFTHMNVNGRIHCNFNPLKQDDSGTISGRFSSTKPNLQQIPSSEAMGKLSRSVFIPEEGHIWSKIDYSQIEYRLIAHYASGPKSEEIRRQYREDPKTDYHKLIMSWVEELDRKNAKRINFGAAYAMGAETCAKKFGWSLDFAVALLEKYHENVPFIKYTRREVSDIANRRGYIRTILNRRARVTDYMRNNRKVYSIFNRLIQGSAADIMKKAMVDAYEKGLYNILVPHLTVHDELDQSVPPTKEGKEALLELKRTMEETIKFKVPIIADVEIGPSWGQLRDFSDKVWEEEVRRIEDARKRNA